MNKLPQNFEYRLNVIPDVSQCKFVSLDIEMYKQDKEKLHIAHGDFACMGITTSDMNHYVISDKALLPEVFDALYACPEWTIQNALYELIQLAPYVKIEDHFIWDTMLVEQTLFGGYYSLFSLQAMARRYLQIPLAKDLYAELANGYVPSKKLHQYVLEDTYTTALIRNEQKKLMDADPQSWKVYTTLEAPMIWVASEIQPVRVDRKAWIRASQQHDALAKSIESEIGYNVNAFAKLKVVLSQHLGVDLPGTGADVLAEYAGDWLVDKVLEARMYRNLVSKYGETWLAKHATSEG